MDLAADRAIGELRRQLALARDDLDLANRRADDERRRAVLLADEVRDLTWDLTQARAAAGVR